MGIKDVRIAKPTEYFKLQEDSNQTVGISHHATGLGKLKIADRSTNAEYGIPVADINSKPLSEWRIDKKG